MLDCNIDNNFLFTGVQKEGFSASMVEKIIKAFSVKNAYATIHDGEDESLFRETIKVWDAFYGKYPVTAKIAPIDRAYDNPISQYSIEILHQMARHGNWDFEKRVNIYYKHLMYWDNFLETRKINFVIFSWLPHESYDYILYLLCKVKEIKTCMCYRDGVRYFLTNKSFFMIRTVEHHAEGLKSKYYSLQTKYREIDEKEIKLPQYAEEYLQEIIYKFKNAENSKMGLLSKRRINKIKHDYGNPKEAFKELKARKKTIKNFYWVCREYTVGTLKTKKLIKCYENLTEEPDYSDKYIFYALHYQPECTSSPLGGVYANQFLAIQLLAHNLPEGYWLYVKEHPDQTAICRNASYYRELIKIPNVKIISQKITSEKLVKNAMAVATLTGTVMFEAQVVQKPCLCLGYSHMEVLNGVYKIDTNEECKKAINEIIAGEAKITTLKDIKLFWLLMDEICFDVKDEIEYYNKLISHIDMK